MKLNRLLVIFIALIAVALLASAAQGQGDITTTPTLLAFGPTTVQPNVVSNSASVELVVVGNDFADGAVVILDNYGALSTTFVSASLLRAELPAAVPAGIYTITVINPNGISASLQRALTVTAAPGTPDPTETPAPTAFIRPLLTVQSYGASSSPVTPGTDLDFEMTFVNSGQNTATNIVATFVAGDFIARVTGGVRALGTLEPGQTNRFWQPLSATRDIAGKSTAVLQVDVTYTDANGTAYSETFNLTFPVVRPAGGVAATATPTPTSTPTPSPTITPTPAPQRRPQLLISGYATDINQLEPGLTFELQLNIQNMGNANARRVTMILGGGSSSGGSAGGTPGSGGGLSGAGGEFSKFAPVGASNVQFLGDLLQGDSLDTAQALIVNATTEPGAYPVKVSFVYNDEQNAEYVDEQIITLLVYERPAVEINFYTEPPPFFAGQPNSLPLQLINVGSGSAVFGNFTVTGAAADFTNNTIFIGALDPGGFFPLDAVVIPQQPGPLDLIVSVGYTDDFNQAQAISKTLTVEVLDAPIFEEPTDPGLEGGEGGGGVFEPPIDQGTPETLAQKLWRFIKGMLGLSSGRPQPDFGGPIFEEVPFPQEGPFPEEGVPVEVVPRG